MATCQSLWPIYVQVEIDKLIFQKNYYLSDIWLPGLNLSGVDGISPSVSRSESVCSLASSTNTVITPAEIRALTNNYQKMLKQATKEIKKLNVEKWKLEQEQDKLLNTNLELAEQIRKMIDTDKQWKGEKKVKIFKP